MAKIVFFIAKGIFHFNNVNTLQPSEQKSTCSIYLYMCVCDCVYVIEFHVCRKSYMYCMLKKNIFK